MNYKFEINKSEELDCQLASFTNINFKTDSGFLFKDIKIAYKTFGKINKNKNNVILVCHALTGDQYVSGLNPITKREGWWSRMVGPNKPIDTNKFFVICSNVLGGCTGSTGPKEINKSTNKNYGASFPSITIKDIVYAQKLLIYVLEIRHLSTP